LELDAEVPIELENVPDIRIEEMDFTQRTLNSLKRADVFTLRDLLRRTKADLKEIRGLGQKSLNEVEAKLREMGYELRQGKLKDLPERLEVGDFEEGDESDLEEME
ncbi:MAG: hypothetical protein K6T17_01020, partial [Fimbriimonadales bacterium]|nr:hypothetical protein [Fimbriimonadales bacterium]